MKKRKYIIIAVSVFLVAILLSVTICYFCVCTVEYTIPLEGITTPVRVAVISDLHGREFGRQNRRLINKVREQKPDAVFLVGDMIAADADETAVQKLLSLVSTLSEIAPVYFSAGNHEVEYMESQDTLLQQITAAGATVVNDCYVDVTIAGQPLRIGGTMGHGFAFGRSWKEFEASAEYVFLKDFEQTDVPKICLAHMPDTFIFNGAYNLWDVDLAISGHTHGGLVRLPFSGGLYAPMQGFFPEYDRGLFRLGEHMQLLVTSGLSGYDWIPRVNNMPELVVAELVPQNNS